MPGDLPQVVHLDARISQVRRVAGGNVDALVDVAGLATGLDEAIAPAVIGLRETGYSWTEIAARLGVSRQATQQRWGRS